MNRSVSTVVTVKSLGENKSEVAVFSCAEMARAFANWFLAQPHKLKQVKVEEVNGAMVLGFLGEVENERRL